MKIISELGGIKEVYKILKNYGWRKNFHAFYMQVKRKKLSKDASLIIYDYCHKNGIVVSLDDFQEER